MQFLHLPVIFTTYTSYAGLVSYAAPAGDIHKLRRPGLL